MRKLILALAAIFVSIQMIMAQDVNKIVEKIYQHALRHEKQLAEMPSYKYKQSVYFAKLNGDDEIDKQSKREFEVYVRSYDDRKRVLLSAMDYEDGEWTDVTEKLKNKKWKSQSRSKSFSLTEMVGPENRQNYNFKLINKENINGYETYHLNIDVLEEDEEYFGGDLWVDTTDYALIRAILVPSDFPTGVDSMNMFFNMEKIANTWVPITIQFYAEISFLFIFKGKIKSDITFSGYQFNQEFDDQWFESLYSDE